MSDTLRLALPLLAASQAQKHVTHNEALVRLDALVQLAVRSGPLNTPPASPAEGDVYLAGDTPTGVWAGQAARVAEWRDGLWTFLQPREGWRATVLPLVTRTAKSMSRWLGPAYSGDLRLVPFLAHRPRASRSSGVRSSSLCIRSTSFARSVTGPRRALPSVV